MQQPSKKILPNKSKEEILQNVSDVSLPFVIFGIGMYAKQLFKYLENNGIKIEAACVDTKYFNPVIEFLNVIPVHPVNDINSKLNSFNIIFGECHSGIAGIFKICNKYFDLVHIEEGLIDGCFNF